LSSLRIIIDGAEPVSADVCKEFAKEMSAFGMKSTVICPSYGLSEATLVVSTPKTVREFEEIHTIREQVRVGEKIIESNIKGDNTISFVDVGECLDNYETKIVDGAHNKVGELVVGSLLLKGKAVFNGYYNNPEATNSVFDKDGWFDTGDLGFMKDSKLVLTGRAKDVIFVNGENYYSYDIERICEEVEDEDFSKVAVCGVYNNKLKQDQLICFVEFNGNPDKFNNISLKIKKQVIQKIGIGISYLIPVDEIPVTVSGKIKRYLLLEQFNKGKFNTLLNAL
jgi:fatty-acyl-CoA synthase